MVTGTNVVAYVPKGSWSKGGSGISVANVEGTSVTNTLVPTPNIVNSCAANPLTGKTVCTANNTDVYVLTGTTLSNTLTSKGSGTISFSGGSCTDCGVAIDAPHNRAAIGLSIGGAAGFQILDLATLTFEKPFKSPAGVISEDPLVDPSRNFILSASENNNFEIVNIANPLAPTFFEKLFSNPGYGDADSTGEDCTTGIALAPGEFSSPSQVFLADLTQATFTAGSPKGTWIAPSQVQTLSESFLAAGASAVAVAQGTHIGIVAGEFGGNAITAIALPATSGAGTPQISDWVTCNIAGFSNGYDPHTTTAYQSPNGAKDAIAVLANWPTTGTTATGLAVVDLTKMLNKSIVPRTAAGHGCASASGTLPGTVATLLPVP